MCQGVDNDLLMNNGLNLEQINWINNINYEYPLNCSVQIRHQHKPVNCKIFHENNLFKTIFSEPIRAVAPGQSAVFYNNEICLGGGIITETF